MGIMTLTNFRDEVRFILDNRQDLTTTFLDRWINWAYTHVAQPHIHRHPALFVSYNAIALVLDDVEYPIDSTTVGFQILGIHSVVYVNGAAASVTANRQRLKYVDLRSIDQGATGGWQVGRPTAYTVHNNQLMLNARPGTDEVGDFLLVRCYRSPAALAGAGEQTVMAPVWDEVITVGAGYRGWRQLNQPDRAELLRAEFVSLANDTTDLYQIAGEDWGSGFQLDYVPFMDGRG